MMTGGVGLGVESLEERSLIESELGSALASGSRRLGLSESVGVRMLIMASSEDEPFVAD